MESSSYILYFVLLFLIHIIDGNQWRCDYSYVQKANSYFKFHKIPANWRDARLRCQLEGAMLASPYPKVVQDTLLDLMARNGRNRTIFTGIHATFSKGDYYTVNGTPLSKIPLDWMESEPDNKNDAESCLILTSKGLAADTKCADTYPYFCYKERKDDDIFVDVCGTPDRAYEYSDATHSCYKFHTVPRTWSGAHMACSAEGGHLAIINSHAESEVIKRLYSKYPDVVMNGNFRKDMAFVGFHDWDQHADWRTIHGETLKVAGYETFAKGEPGNQTTGEYCGAVNKIGLLGDIYCNIYLPFICEKAPKSLVCDEVDSMALIRKH